jgi:hypothetical protein
MDHRSVYQMLMSPENESALLHLLEEQGVLQLLRARSVEVRRDRSPAYILLKVDAEHGVIAQCTGVFVDVSSMVQALDTAPYFLQIIGLAEQKSGEAETSQAASLEHELLHLTDTMDVIERHPEYPRRIFEYGMRNTKDPALLSETIDLEIFKLFALEPQAFALDYTNGETFIDVPFFGRSIRVPCDSQEEFVLHRIADYVNGLQIEFHSIHPDQTARVHEEFKLALERHGRSLLGPSAYLRIRESSAIFVQKMLDSSQRIVSNSGKP